MGSSQKVTVQDSEAGHESAAGMNALTLGYNALFFILYLFYFWMVANRWEVS